jgi:hypothetical protein
MHDPFGTMPDAKREGRSVVRTALRRVGSDAPIERRDALREGRHAPPVPRDSPLTPRDAPTTPSDALPVSPDAPPIRRDVPGIRCDAVRRRRYRSRRVRGSSRPSLVARPSVDHAAAEPRACRPSVDHAAASSLDHAPAEPETCRRPRACRPLPREGKRVCRELFGARDDALRIRRDAQNEAASRRGGCIRRHV